MTARKIKLFKIVNHVSGWPFMTAKCCGSSINRQSSVSELPVPDVYGLALPESERITVTHIADYTCKCRGTVISVGGTMRDYVAHGCFISEETR